MPVEDQKVRTLFAQQGIKNHNNFTAIAELIDNCEDAGSTKINISMRDQKDVEYNLQEKVIIFQDDGRGLDNLSQLFDVASNKQHRKDASTKGTHGMGAKNAIDRLGEHSIVISKQKFKTQQSNDPNLKGENKFYIRFGIFPYESRKSTNSRKTKDSGANTRQVAKLLLVCDVQKRNIRGQKSEEIKWIKSVVEDENTGDIQAIKDEEENDILDFLTNNGPFKADTDITDNDDSDTGFRTYMKRQICKLINDCIISPSEEPGLEQISGTSIIVWKIHTKSSKPNLSGYLSFDPNTKQIYLEGQKKEATLLQYFAEHKPVVDGPNKLKPKRNTNKRQPILTIQHLNCVPIPFRVRCIPDSIILGKLTPKQINLSFISFELAELRPDFCKDYNGITYFWKNRKICRSKYADNENDNKKYEKYCMIIDLSNVAIANQYKNQFDQELNVDHVGVNGVLPKGFKSFDVLEKSLKKKFKEYCEQMSRVKLENQIWYEGGADKDGEYTEEIEPEKGDFIYQCCACTKLRSIPRKEIRALSNKSLKLEKEKGIWVSRKNPNLRCSTLGLVDSTHDLCTELMDVFLSAEIGHGSLCKDETCKLCKPERIILKKKREPKYFLEKNTRKFEEKLTESNRLKDRRNKDALEQHENKIAKREEETASHLDSLESSRKKTKRKPRKRAVQATFTDLVLNQHEKNIRINSSRSKKSNTNPVNLDDTETGSVNFNSTIGSINPLNSTSETIYPCIPLPVFDLEAEPPKKRNKNVPENEIAVDLTGETDSEDERRMTSQREQISQRTNGIKKEAEDVNDKASTVETPVWGMQESGQLEDSQAGDSAVGSAGAKNESFDTDVVEQILNPENDEPENTEAEQTNDEPDDNDPENNDSEQNTPENIELEINNSKNIDPKTIAQQLLPYFKPINQEEEGNFENTPGSPDNSIPTTNLEESHSKTSQSTLDPIAAEAISKTMIEQEQKMRNTITWGGNSGYIEVVREAIIEHGGDSWTEEEQFHFYMKHLEEQARTHVIPLLFPKQKNENAEQDPEE